MTWLNLAYAVEDALWSMPQDNYNDNIMTLLNK